MPRITFPILVHSVIINLELDDITDATCWPNFYYKCSYWMYL